MKPSVTPLLLFALSIACAPSVVEEPETYKAEIELHRAARIERLTSETGWLTLVGLFWLEPGEHPIGSAPDSEITLPEDKAPASLGVVRIEDGKALLEVAEGATVTVDGEPIETIELTPDNPGPATIFESGDLSAHMIARDGALGLRVRDRKHPARSTFKGIESFETDWAWRLEARFEPYDPPRTLEVPTVMGNLSEQPSSGALVFEALGETLRLDVVADPGAEELFVIFADETTGKETYGGGRYLYVSAPDESGRVVVDFNKAYNPPCVFTPFATCPLPPPQNKLAVRVEAGEKTYGSKSVP